MQSQVDLCVRLDFIFKILLKMSNLNKLLQIIKKEMNSYFQVCNYVFKIKINTIIDYICDNTLELHLKYIKQKYF